MKMNINRAYGFVIVMLIVALSGCASMATPQTLGEQIFYAKSTLVAIDNSAADLLERKRISKADAIRVWQRSGEASTYLDIARLADGTVDIDGAQEGLRKAQEILYELENYLRQQEASK